MLPFGLSLLLIATVFISCASTFICLYWMRHQLKKAFKRETANHIKVETPQITNEEAVDHKIEEILNERLEAIVSTFKAQIPAASMFLGKTSEDKLKNQAFQELVKAVPDLKQAVLNPTLTLEPSKLKKAKLPAYLSDQQWKTMVYSTLGIAFLIGIVFGLLELSAVILTKSQLAS